MRSCPPHKSVPQVIGLLKVKSSWYVIRRRIRQTVTSKLWRPLGNGGVKDHCPRNTKARDEQRTLESAVKSAKAALSDGMENLKHVPGCKAEWRNWEAFAHGFVDWWLRARLPAPGGAGEGAEGAGQSLEQVLQETERNYASLMEAYCTECHTECP